MIHHQITGVHCFQANPCICFLCAVLGRDVANVWKWNSVRDGVWLSVCLSQDQLIYRNKCMNIMNGTWAHRWRHNTMYYIYITITINILYIHVHTDLSYPLERVNPCMDIWREERACTNTCVCVYTDIIYRYVDTHTHIYVYIYI